MVHSFFTSVCLDSPKSNLNGNNTLTWIHHETNQHIKHFMSFKNSSAAQTIEWIVWELFQWMENWNNKMLISESVWSSSSASVSMSDWFLTFQTFHMQTEIPRNALRSRNGDSKQLYDNRLLPFFPNSTSLILSS